MTMFLSLFNPVIQGRLSSRPNASNSLPTSIFTRFCSRHIHKRSTLAATPHSATQVKLDLIEHLPNVLVDIVAQYTAGGKIDRAVTCLFPAPMIYLV